MSQAGRLHPGVVKRRMGRGERRVQLDRSRKLGGGGFGFRDREPADQCTAAQVGKVRLDIRTGRPARARQLQPGNPRLEGSRHVIRDLVLHVEQVRNSSVKAFRPELGPASSVNQPCRNAQVLAVALHAAADEVARSEASADLARIRGPTADAER